MIKKIMRRILYIYKPMRLEARKNKWTRTVKRKANCTGTIRVNGPGTILAPRNLYIGDNTHFGGHYFIDARGCVKIGENCHISRNFVCYSANHNYEGDAIPYDNTLIKKMVQIANNVWIGMNVCLIPGVQIGEGAIIGMGAVVVKEVPPLAIMGGNPAKILKYRDSKHYRKMIEAGRYGGMNGQLVNKQRKNYASNAH